MDGKRAGRIAASWSCTLATRGLRSSFSPPASGTASRTSARPTRSSSTIRRTPTTTRTPITTVFHSTRRKSRTRGRRVRRRACVPTRADHAETRRRGEKLLFALQCAAYAYTLRKRQTHSADLRNAPRGGPARRADVVRPRLQSRDDRRCKSGAGRTAQSPSADGGRLLGHGLLARHARCDRSRDVPRRERRNLRNVCEDAAPAAGNPPDRRPPIRNAHRAGGDVGSRRRGAAGDVAPALSRDGGGRERKSGLIAQKLSERTDGLAHQELGVAARDVVIELADEFVA